VSGKILYCDSRGDKRFSPFFCWLEAYGVRDSIEQHYQKAKVFVAADGELVSPRDWKDAKRLKKGGYARYPEFKLPDGRYCPGKYLVFGWYASLWLKYLDGHPELVGEAAGYDEYVDRFKHGFPLCQADCVRLYVKRGRAALLEHCREFFAWLRA
jgi:hypothetical protein